MALKKCTECDKSISSKAKSCPGCGAPVQRGSLIGRALKIFLIGFFTIGIIGSIVGESGISQSTRSKTNAAISSSTKINKPATKSLDPPSPQTRNDWQLYRSVSQIDDKPIVSLSVDAENLIDRWPSKKHRPRLVIRYQEGRLVCYINVGGPPNVERGGSGATVTLRFDDRPAEKFLCSRSTDNQALFFNHPKKLVKRLLNTNRLIFRFTPFNSSPATSVFLTRGLREAIKPIEEVSGK